MPVNDGWRALQPREAEWAQQRLEVLDGTSWAAVKAWKYALVQPPEAFCQNWDLLALGLA